MFKQLFAIIRRLFSRSGQAIIDKNLVNLMEQQILDTKAKLKESENALVEITAKRNLQLKEQEKVKTELEELEQNLTTLMARPPADIDQSLAERLANKFAEKENALKLLVADIAAKNTTIQKTKEAITATNTTLRNFENRKDSVKSNEALIEATKSISAANSGANSSLNDLEESLKRTEQLQEEQFAKFDASAEMANESSGKNLEDDLIKAGLKTGNATAASVLDRFKPKASTEQPAA